MPTIPPLVTNIVKATLFFEHFGISTDPQGGPQNQSVLNPEAGWTESYYFAYSTFAEDTISTMLLGPTGAITLTSVREKLLPANVLMSAVRATDMANPRSSFLFARLPYRYPTSSGSVGIGTNYFQGNGSYGQSSRPTTWTTIPSSEVDTAVRFKLVAAGGAPKRVLLLRGLPEEIIGRGGAYIRNKAPWAANLTAFGNYLTKQTPLQLRTIWAGNPAPQVVIALTATANDYRSISLSTATPIQKSQGGANVNVAVGDNVIVRGYKGGYRVNGAWRIAAISTTTGPPAATNYFMQPHRRNVAIAATSPQSTTVQALTYTWVPVTLASDEGEIVYERRTGRPFGLLVGAHKAK
jgi:hypothetical protein